MEVNAYCYVEYNVSWYYDRSEATIIMGVRQHDHDVDDGTQ